MRSTNYPRISRAVFCSALLLSQHAAVDANNWATGGASNSRSSTLAVMQPGGRNRPIRDWKAIKRESEEKLKAQAEAKRAAREAGAVEAVGDEVNQVPDEKGDEKVDGLETASVELLDLKEGTPGSLGVMLAKVVVISTAGVYGARRLVALAKAFIKARKGNKKASGGEGEADDSSAVANTQGVSDDDDNDHEGGKGKAQVINGGGEEEEDGAAEEENNERTGSDGFVTADEEDEEDDASLGASAKLGSMGKDVTNRANGSVQNVTSVLGEATTRGDGIDQGAREGGLPSQLPKGVDSFEGGNVDVSYV